MYVTTSVYYFSSEQHPGQEVREHGHVGQIIHAMMSCCDCSTLVCDGFLLKAAATARSVGSYLSFHKEAHAGPFLKCTF